MIDAARHDPAAFGRLYRAHYARIAGYLLRRTGDEHTAEDLAGETFIAAMDAIGRYRHTGAPFSAWLMRIATNKANRWARTRRRRLRREATSSPPAASNSTPHEDAGPIRAAMDTLCVEHQTVLYLHHVEHLSIEQVALVLGVREGTVKSRLHRARAALLAAFPGETP